MVSQGSSPNTKQLNQTNKRIVIVDQLALGAGAGGAGLVLRSQAASCMKNRNRGRRTSNDFNRQTQLRCCGAVCRSSWLQGLLLLFYWLSTDAKLISGGGRTTNHRFHADIFVYFSCGQKDILFNIQLFSIQKQYE